MSNIPSFCLRLKFYFVLNYFIFIFVLSYYYDMVNKQYNTIPSRLNYLRHYLELSNTSQSVCMYVCMYVCMEVCTCVYSNVG